MGIGTGIFLLAVGAILRFAVTTTTKGLNIQTVGDILMIAGALGILFSLFFWNSWGGFGNRRTTTVVHDREVPVVRDREVY
jgi:hypothetical protein